MNKALKTILKITGAVIVCATVLGVAIQYLSERLRIAARGPMTEDFDF